MVKEIFNADITAIYVIDGDVPPSEMYIGSNNRSLYENDQKRSLAQWLIIPLKCL